MLKLLVATKNAGKVRELKSSLGELPIALKSLDEFEAIAEVEETGGTFAANARLKAAGYAAQTGLWALADDSGLEVAALGGAPGIYSARYAGAAANEREKIAKLLREIAAADDENRRARFVCAMAISNADGATIFTAEGICEGTIARAPRGTHGFGYDPIFIPDGFDRTFAELSDAQKQRISHRALALTKIIRYLRDFIAV